MRILPYRERWIKLPPTSSFGERPEDVFDKWQHHLLKNWIPSQPDSKELTALLKDCDFSVVPFLCIVGYRRDELLPFAARQYAVTPEEFSKKFGIDPKKT